jgi:hypothetical protein
VPYRSSVPAEHVRLLRPKSYRRVLADAHTGRPIAVDDHPTAVDPDPQTARTQIQQMLTPATVLDADEPQHDPSARLARLIDLRDVHCCGPGCAATRTDRDHLDPYPHGPTNADNLGRLSPRCHAAKHADWTLQRHPDGSVTWHSGLGRTYHRPSPHRPPPQADLHNPPPPRPASPEARTRDDHPAEQAWDSDEPDDDPPPF